MWCAYKHRIPSRRHRAAVGVPGTMPPRAKKPRKDDDKLEAPAAIAEHHELEVTAAKPAVDGQAPTPAVSELAVSGPETLQKGYGDIGALTLPAFGH